MRERKRTGAKKVLYTALIIAACALAYLLFPLEDSGTYPAQSGLGPAPAMTPAPYPRERAVFLRLSEGGIPVEKGTEDHTYEITADLPEYEMRYTLVFSITEGYIRSATLVFPRVEEIALGPKATSVEKWYFDLLAAARARQRADITALVPAVWDALTFPDSLPLSYKLLCVELAFAAGEEPVLEEQTGYSFTAFLTGEGALVLSLSLL